MLVLLAANRLVINDAAIRDVVAQLHVAFIRHVGPYESVTDTLWRRLKDWGNRSSCLTI